MSVYLRVETVATQLNVSAAAIYREVQRGHLKANRVGRLIRISEEDLRAYLNRPQDGVK